VFRFGRYTCEPKKLDLGPFDPVCLNYAQRTVRSTYPPSTADLAQTRTLYYRGSLQSRPEQEHEDAREAHAEVLHEEEVLARLDEGGEVVFAPDPNPPPAGFVLSTRMDETRAHENENDSSARRGRPGEGGGVPLEEVQTNLAMSCRPVEW
jgi:hypothetical protein